MFWDFTEKTEIKGGVVENVMAFFRRINSVSYTVNQVISTDDVTLNQSTKS